MSLLDFHVESIEADIQGIIDQLLAPPAQSEQVADGARSFIAEVDANNRQISGTIPPHEITVDGREGAPLESVKPDRGVITVEWQVATDMLMSIYNSLVDHSPRLSGRYAESHVLFADGREVPVDNAIPHAHEYVFLNVQPYARKIEGIRLGGGTRTREPLSSQAPDGVYRVVAQEAQQRFRDQASITFTFAAPVGPVIAGGRGNRASARNPAILVTQRT